jgi:hypothetical protein
LHRASAEQGYRADSYFGVQHLEEEPALLAAARKSTSYTGPHTPAQRAWVARAQQLARELQAGPFMPDGLDEVLGRLRGLRSRPEDTGLVPGCRLELAFAWS